MSIDLDAHPASLQAAPAMTQADEQSGGRRYGKQPPQPIRPPSVPMDIGGATVSFGVTELGPPPSYA
jgi:hypothetical protein